MLHCVRTFAGFLGILVCLFPHQKVTGQSLPDKLNVFLQKHAAEKLTLITDKPYYVAGDTIFFRVSTRQQNSDNMVEVQLIAPVASQNNTYKLLLTNGTQVSYITLPKDAVTGDYVVRAFSTVGWESYALVSVYNPNQAKPDYQVCNWVNPNSGPQLTITRQVNAWEIGWDLKQSNLNDKGWLIIASPNQVYYSQEVDLSQSENKTLAPLNALPTQAAQVTLVANSGQVIGNFQVILNQAPDQQLKLRLNKTVYQTREQVELQIGTGSSSNKLENSLLTLRVMEQTKALNNVNENGDSLRDDVKIRKEFPQISYGKLVLENTAGYDYIFVLKGKLISALDNKPVANSLIHLLVPGTNQLEVLFTDKMGNIQVELDPFENTQPMVFRAIHEGEEVKNVSFVPDPSQNILSWHSTFSPINPGPEQEELLNRLKLLHKINQAFNPNLEGDNVNRSNLFKPTAFQESKLKPTTSYDLSKYEKSSNVTEIFRELVPAVEVVKRKDGMRARLYARLIKKFYNYYPLFLIDGIPTYDVETILNIPADQLVKIDVFNTTTALVPFDVLSTGGVIALYTKNRNFNHNLLHDNIIEFPGTLPSYQWQPNRKQESYLPYFDPLLYWNPRVKLDTSGPTPVTFLTNDQVGTYVVEATYLNERGEVVTATTNFSVEPEK